MSESIIDQQQPALGASDVYDETALHLVSKLHDNGNRTLGTILTLVEASLGDSKQAEALKSVIRREIFMMIDRNQGEIYERAKMQRSGLKPKAYIEFKDSNGDFSSYTIED